MASQKYLGTSDIARISQVTTVTVGNWIRSGKLKASRVPGGNYRVTADDLVSFLEKANMLVPPSLIKQHPRVLIIGDGQDPTRRISGILADIDRSWHVDIACNCLAAGAKVVKTEPDLVILQLPMPGMDPRVCEQICRTSAWARCKLLVILTSDEPAEMAKAQQIGADHCLADTFTDDEFRSTVRELMPQAALPL